MLKITFKKNSLYPFEKIVTRAIAKAIKYDKLVYFEFCDQVVIVDSNSVKRKITLIMGLEFIDWSNPARSVCGYGKCNAYPLKQKGFCRKHLTLMKELNSKVEWDKIKASIIIK